MRHVNVLKKKSASPSWWRVVTAFVLAASGALVMVGTATATTPTPGTASQVTALVKASVTIKTANSTVLANMPYASLDYADLIYHIPTTCVTATACVYGDTTGTKTLVLFGNSHARMWLPAIIPSATADGYKIVLLGKNECPVVTLSLPAKEYPGCDPIISESIATIKKLKPAVVLLADRTVESEFTAAKWQAGFTATIKAIKPSGARVVVIGDINEFTTSPVACIATNPKAIQTKCTVANPNPKEKGLEKAEMASAKAAKDLYVNPSSWLCYKTKCSPIIGNFIAYWSADHVSVAYAQYLSGVMGTALASTLKPKVA